MEESKIQKFYECQKVFITGGTGFIGKVLIEKLLRSTNVSTIYVLIRPKAGQNVQSRMNQILENEFQLFSKVKTQNPNFKSRIVEIAGDCTFPELGLSESEKNNLIANINIVFHAAASVSFKEDIKEAYKNNVQATENLLQFCKQVKNLKSVVHVSTAFCHFPLDQVDETFYDLPVDTERLQQLIVQPSDEEILKVIQGWPNTYTFTKAWAETLIKNTSENLPIAIFRPAIVISTYREPIENWTDSLGGPAGIISGISLGILRVFPLGDVSVSAELVPVDMTVAALISIAWDITKGNKERKGKVPIYNFVSSIDNPITWHEFAELNKLQYQNYPLKDSFWAPNCRLVKNGIEYKLLFLIFHYFPATFLDFAKIMTFKKPQMISKYRKMYRSLNALSPFTIKNCKFSNNNMKTLWLTMNFTDKTLFNFDLNEIKWLQYFRNYQNGLRLHLYKEPIETLPKAKIKAERLAIMHKILIYVVYFIGVNALGLLLAKWFASFFNSFRSYRILFKAKNSLYEINL